MNEITQVLERIQKGEPSAAEALLPLVYDELRKLAAAKMAQVNAGAGDDFNAEAWPDAAADCPCA